MIARHRLSAQVGTIPVGLVIVWPQRNDAVVILLCFGELADEAAYRGAIIEIMRIARGGRDCSIVGLERARLIVGPVEQPADRIEQQRFSARVTPCLTGCTDGIRGAPERKRNAAGIDPAWCKSGILLQQSRRRLLRGRCDLSIARLRAELRARLYAYTPVEK